MNEKEDIDVVIDRIYKWTIETWGSAGLSEGIMELMAINLLHTLRMQKQEKFMRLANAGKEES